MTEAVSLGAAQCQWEWVECRVLSVAMARCRKRFVNHGDVCVVIVHTVGLT